MKVSALRSKISDLHFEIEDFKSEILLKVEQEDIEIVKVVGQGSFGQVFKARFRGTIIALKRIKSCGSPDVYAEVVKEAESMRTLRHHNVLMLMGIIETDKNETYIASEFAPHGDLECFIRRHKKIKFSKILMFLQGICNGMSYLHSKKMIHRDLKLDNVMLSDGYTVKIADFGLSFMQSSKPDVHGRNRTLSNDNRVSLSSDSLSAPLLNPNNKLIDVTVDMEGVGHASTTNVGTPQYMACNSEFLFTNLIILLI